MNRPEVTHSNEEVCRIKTDLLKLTDQICQENQIPYFAIGNLMASCVHYHDFIPDEAEKEWELGFMREDHDRILSILRNSKLPEGICLSETAPTNKKRPKWVPFLENRVDGITYHIRLCVFDHIPDDCNERDAFMERVKKREASFLKLSELKKKKQRTLYEKLYSYPRNMIRSKARIEKAARSKINDSRANHLQAIVLHHSVMVEKKQIFPVQRIAFRDMTLPCPNDLLTWTNIQDEELAAQNKALQEAELFLLEKVDEICRKLNIGYFIVAGTLLGSLRHGGFIPWDDDIDVGMLRADYDVFMEKAGEYLDDRFFLASRENEPTQPYVFTKLRLNNTECLTPFIKRVNCHHGIGLDIFPFDYLPNDEKEREAMRKRVKELAAKHMEIAHTHLMAFPEEHFPPRNPMEWWHKVKYEYLRNKRLNSSLEPSREAYLKEATKYNKDAEKLGLTKVASFVVAYTDMDVADLLPYGRRKFEHLEVNVPHHPEALMENHYGDFMKLPPKHQQIGHKVISWSVDMDKIRNNV